MLDALGTHESLSNKIMTSYVFMYVTKIKIPIKNGNIIYIYNWSVHFSECFDIVILTYSFGLEKSQSLVFYLKYIVLKRFNNTIPNFRSLF